MGKRAKRMKKITMDHSAMVFFDRIPGIKKLKELHEDDKIKLYSSISVDRELASMDAEEKRLYEKLRKKVFGKEQKELNLMEHGDLCLLVNHIRSKRDFFITLEKEKYDNLGDRKGLNVRFPDDSFLNEIGFGKKG